MKSDQMTGIIWMITHCFLISLMSVIIVHISGAFHVFQIVFFHNAVAFLLLLPFVVTGGRYKKLNTKKIKLHVLRAVLGVVSMSMYFYAFTVIPLTQARAIALTGPLVSSLFAVAFLKEKMGWHRTLALVVGFSGALVILRPGTDSFSYASLMVVAAVLMWATVDMTIKSLTKTESTTTQIFYLTGLMSLFSMPGAIWHWNEPETHAQTFWLIAIGVIFLVNVMAVFNAFKNADVTVIMPFDFSGMVFATILAYLAFGEIVDDWTIVGSVIIMASSIYVARREAAKFKEVQAAPLRSEE